MIVAVGLVMFIIGMLLSSMCCIASKADLEEQLYDRDKKIAIARDYIQIILTSDLELDLKETAQSLGNILGGDKE